MSGFDFSALNDYVMYALFKYLPLAERTRFERTNKRWAQLLERLWFNQKALSVTYSLAPHPFHDLQAMLQFHQQNICQQEQHRVYEIDAIRVKSDEAMVGKDHFIYGVIKRCENLDTLILDVYFGVDYNGIDESGLARLCPKLAHLASAQDNLKELFNVNNESETGLALKCLQLPQCYEGEKHLRFVESMGSLTRIESLSLLGGTDSRALGVLLPTLIELNFEQRIEREVLVLIVEKGLMLKKLSLRRTLLRADDVENICRKVRHLVSIQFFSNINNLQYLKHLKRLENIQWISGSKIYRPQDEQRFSESVQRFLQRMGFNLKSLSFTRFPVEYISLLPTFCPHLKSVSLTIKERPDASNVFVSLTKLTCLTRLTLLSNELSCEGIKGILRANPGLKEAIIGFCSRYKTENCLAFDEVKNIVGEYAKCHSKRAIDLILVVKRNCGVFNPSFVEIISNLRVYFPRK